MFVASRRPPIPLRKPQIARPRAQKIQTPEQSRTRKMWDESTQLPAASNFLDDFMHARESGGKIVIRNFPAIQSECVR